MEKTRQKNTVSVAQAVLSSKSGNLLLKAPYIGGYVIKESRRMIIRKVRMVITSGEGQP